ncbi:MULTISPECIES: serine/threonine protein kinase [Nostocales]|uniref:Serine/threonine protein kinase n=3 Tax=Nostocales TaxID=1161 RepID=A0A8S9TG18_9CYAN|nr:serine/threonine-protein kinase [Tolypothrix bouteillei]KAF3890409.1 serine/threonine protein kinase [Tolypothrix bouteillei VB521301]
MTKTDVDGYIGHFLNNRYLIKDAIGRGGMGKVYLAEDAAKGGMPVAVKILSLSLSDPQMSQRFAREIFIGAQLGRKSKHIVRVLSYGIADAQVPFYVMEYLQGKNLKDILKNKKLTISDFLEISYQICLGLQCAHQGVSYKGDIYPVIHRDIKPENIFITEDTKANLIVKILDFGIAKFLTERSGLTLTDSFIGSLPYCSPEHMEGRKLLDVRSDIYSLGVLMYEMLTRKHPFSTTSQSFGNWYQAHRFQAPPAFEEIVPQLKIPLELKKLVMNCLAKDVNARPQNINQILETLEKIQRNINDEIEQDKNQKSSPVQLVPVTSLSEKICLEKNWPKNKPIAPICFPHVLQTQQGNVATFWAMLPQKEITKFLNEINGTEFIYSQNLHPMLLWVTVLCDGKFELTRWLSYCLDFKDNRSQNIIEILAKSGYYHLLFFSLEEPSICSHVMTLSISSSQRQQLINWLENVQKLTLESFGNDSKNELKLQYEKMKPDILKRLAINRQKQNLDVKKWMFHLFEKFLQFLVYR